MTYERAQKPHAEIRLPPCPLPRPGDKVTWFEAARRRTGHLTGHTGDAHPIVLGTFGGEIHAPSFNALRVEDPFDRKGPLWERLSPDVLWTPTTDEDARFSKALDRIIPPGLTYMDLVEEVWKRGFEVFVVGGTVRDIISGSSPNDIDLVTTMPLRLALDVLRPMFRDDKLQVHPTTGFCRVGGTPKSGDPFIDLKMMCLDNPGTESARFGADLQADLMQRDFACNALYYDPINKVILDPHGSGIADAEQKKLTIVSDSKKKKEIYNQAKVVIRFFKFVAGGYEPHPMTSECIDSDYIPALGAMKKSQLISYTHTQVLSKHNPSAWPDRLQMFKEAMILLGHHSVWDTTFEPVVGAILKL